MFDENISEANGCTAQVTEYILCERSPDQDQSADGPATLKQQFESTSFVKAEPCPSPEPFDGHLQRLQTRYIAQSSLHGNISNSAANPTTDSRLTKFTFQHPHPSHHTSPPPTGSHSTTSPPRFAFFDTDRRASLQNSSDSGNVALITRYPTPSSNRASSDAFAPNHTETAGVSRFGAPTIMANGISPKPNRYTDIGPAANSGRRAQSFDSGHVGAFAGNLYNMDDVNAGNEIGNLSEISGAGYGFGRGHDTSDYDGNMSLGAVYSNASAQQQHYEAPIQRPKRRGPRRDIERPFRDTYNEDGSFDDPRSNADITLLPSEPMLQFPSPAARDYAPASTQSTDNGGTSKMAREDASPISFDIQGDNDEKEGKSIRRRSSKACDGCRKSKCKCERASPGAPCSNCILLGIPCTFLGVSRKRGPPKGYIDAIEARLHQTEALLGIMIAAAKGSSHRRIPQATGSKGHTKKRKSVRKTQDTGDFSWGPESGTDGWASASDSASGSTSDEDLSADERAGQLLRDIAQDPLAHEIINRVDNSPYGYTGRQLGLSSNDTKSASGSSSRQQSQLLHMEDDSDDKHEAELKSTHPSNEWQDKVVTMLKNIHRGRKRSRLRGDDREQIRPQMSMPSLSVARGLESHTGKHLEQSRRPDLQIQLSPHQSSIAGPASAGAIERSHSHQSLSIRPISQAIQRPGTYEYAGPPPQRLRVVSPDSAGPRQKRRLALDEVNTWKSYNYDPVFEDGPSSAPPSLIKRSASVEGGQQPGYRSSSATRTGSPASLVLHPTSVKSIVSPIDNNYTSQSSGSDNDDDLVGAVGQLSLNEDEQVRYHGKASGLHLLVESGAERMDGRDEGGIWRFPKARVWPPLPTADPHNRSEEDQYAAQLPALAIQEHLLELYFTYVHPFLPVVHKEAFFDSFRHYNRSEANSPISPPTGPPSMGTSGTAFNRRSRRVPTLLLLAMFAITARYSSTSAPFPQPPHMWPAGDDYLDRAKIILDKTYASSRPSTCQALLLMGYREIGIGAMASAFCYIGMAIRMAQDLGMHRSAEGWTRAGLGGKLFNEWELAERKRIWYSCVVMDKYVSTYIGRPVSIFERDFDTALPRETDLEELEQWKPHSSRWDNTPELSPDGPSHIISCFNASATLSGILSMIVQSIYAVRPVSGRHAESAYLESLLSKWYIELPPHLCHHAPGRASNLRIPPPHILTLHMQYWCTVLLLHRPFIRNPSRLSPDMSEDGSTRTAQKRHELCAGAAMHITSIVSTYMDNYTLKRCPVFLCYYVFAASIMHVISLTTFPNDPQARVGLYKCMEALRRMEIVWPSAGRAHELLRGSKFSAQGAEFSVNSGQRTDRHKRAAEEQSLDDSFTERRSTGDYISSHSPLYNPLQGGEYGDMYQNNDTGAITYGGPSYDRWSPNSMSSFNTLSTSALPSVYGSGLIDERNRSGHGVMEIDTNSHNTATQRYPSSSWHDFATFTQGPYADVNISTDDSQLQSHHPQRQSEPGAEMYHYVYPQ